MGWQEAKKRYRDGLTTTAQSTEDLVARRVLKGLGLVERQVYQAERALFGDVCPDDALWPRTYTVMRAMMARAGYRGFFGIDNKNPGEFHIEVKDVSPDSSEIKEMAGILGDCTMKPFPLIMTRVKGTNTSRTYALVDPEKIPRTIWVKPPISFLAPAGDWWIAVSDTEEFIKRFGPFQLFNEE